MRNPLVPLTAPPKGQFKRWMFAPPGPHGAILKDRTVSNLELFYDLAYQPLGVALAVSALAALGAGLLAPRPWLLAVLLVAILTAPWFFVVARMIRASVWGDATGG